MAEESNSTFMKYKCATRSPASEDCEEMAGLAEQLGYPSTGKQVQVRLDGMRDSNRYAVYVAELPGGHIAGWIGVQLFCAVEMDNCAEITGLIVDSQLRSLGIGKALLDAAEEWARNHGCEVICVRSNVTRDRAHRFYQRNGYKRIKTQAAFRKSL